MGLRSVGANTPLTVSQQPDSSGTGGHLRPKLFARLPWQPLTCWDQPLIYLERALEQRGQDEWHFNVLLRCLVTSTIDHSAAAHTPLPHCPVDPLTALGESVYGCPLAKKRKSLDRQTLETSPKRSTFLDDMDNSTMEECYETDGTEEMDDREEEEEEGAVEEEEEGEVEEEEEEEEVEGYMDYNEEPMEHEEGEVERGDTVVLDGRVQSPKCNRDDILELPCVCQWHHISS
ncbi:hypothetical protein PAMA_004302 [Pampus argenteus]